MEIMALRVDPIPQKCNVSNHGIAHMVKGFVYRMYFGVKLMYMYM